MSKEHKIIAGVFREGKFIPFDVCADIAAEFEGQQVAFTLHTVEPEKIRTIKQNRSLHLYFSMLSKALNNAGCDQRGIMSRIGNGAPVPWSEFSVKALWKSVQLHRHGKDSTTKMTSSEYSKEHRIFDNMISEASGGVSLPLPSRESQGYEQY